MGALTVGQLAKRSGLSVRTLHHYDEIGLLSPADRTAAGYRLYGAAEVERLQRIRLLQALGFALADVGRLLEGEGVPVRRLLELHLEALRQRVRAEQRLCRKLEAAVSRLDADGSAAAEELLEIMEDMAMLEKYYTQDQMEALEERRRQVGEKRIRQVEAEWPALIAEVRTAMARGVEPTEPEALALAERWRGLVREFTGGDPGIAASVARLYREEPQARERSGLDPEIMRYIGKAQAALGEDGP